MRKAILLLVFLLSVISSVSAEEMKEAWVVSGGFGPIATDSQGNVFGIRQGNPVPYDRGGQIFYGYSLLTTKYDANGIELWTAAHPGVDPGHDLYMIPADIKADAAGNVSVLWQEQCWAAFHYHDDTARYDASGNLTMLTTFSVGRFNYPYAVAVDGSGNTYVASNGEAGGFFWWEMYWVANVIKYAPDGTALSVFTLPDSFAGYYFHMTADSGGNVYVTGNGGTIKYDPAMNQVWANSTIGYRVSADQAGNAYVLSGGSLMKFDTAGNIIWTAASNASDIITDAQGSAYVTGSEGTMKYKADDGSIVWQLPAYGSSIGVDAERNIYVSNGNITKYFRVLDATIDITPRLISARNNGRFTVYIEVPGYDVTQIDISTVTVSTDAGSISALTTVAYGDYDADGIPDLTAKFDIPALRGIAVSGQNTVVVRGKIGNVEFKGIGLVTLQ